MTHSFTKSALFVFFLSISCFSTAQTIKEKNLYNYIMDCLDYWFYPNHTDPQLPQLAYAIREEIISSYNYEYEWDWNSLVYEVAYPLDFVEQIIRGAIIQHITENSYLYAREITSRENARRIADYIYNYLFNYCSQTMYLPQSVFAGCVGRDLKNWVLQVYNQATPYYKPLPY